MVDPEIIKHVAIKTGLGINYISKDAKISELLDQLRVLFKDTQDTLLILKGGTAINRGYLESPKRFSEDLDLDYISEKPLNEKINHVKHSLEHIHGFQLGKPGLIHRTLRFDCRYENEFQRKDIVRIEFYFSHTRIIAVKPTREVLLKSNLDTTTPCLFRIYSLEDLIARKLLALFNRTEGRDIYDTFYLLDLKYDPPQLKTALALLLEAAHQDTDVREFLDATLVNLEKTLGHATYIGNSTNHYLIKAYRPNWREFIATLIEKVEQLRGDF
ncbi:MAG: nucleotidyl transferase AbiEii/AbiGii toxin family protein [Candidatus Helarchaeota archaeon]